MADGCRMAGCPDPPKNYGFCDLHLLRFAHEPMWTPVKEIPGPDDTTTTVCGLCRTEVWALRRIDDDRRPLIVLDRTARPDGKCRVLDGGFRVIQEAKMLQALQIDGVPLYRAHAPVCSRRPKLIDAVL